MQVKIILSHKRGKKVLSNTFSMVLSLSSFVLVRATQNSTHVLISTPLNGCGTLVNETEEELIFWNEIQVDAVIIDNVITRTHDINLPIYCSYSRRKMLSLSFSPRNIIVGSEGTATIALNCMPYICLSGSLCMFLLLEKWYAKSYNCWFLVITLTQDFKPPLIFC